MRAAISDAELSKCLEVFRTALGAYSAMKDCRQEQYVREARSDHEATVEFLTGATPHAGQARWSALQATEKMYKSYLVATGSDVPKGWKGHDLTHLSDVAQAAGLQPADSFFIDSVQCPADVRYGEIPSSAHEAVHAHHAALE